MKRLFLFTVCLSLCLAGGCGKSAPADDASTAREAAESASDQAPAPDSAKEPEPERVEITDKMVTTYIAFQKERIKIVQEHAAEAGKRLAAAKTDVGKLAEQVALTDKLSKELDAKLAAARASLGLAEDEFRILEDAAQSVAAGRSLYNQMGGDAAFAKLEAEQKARIASLPADQRPAAEAELASMTKGFSEVKNGVDLRQKYGDRSADVLLARADELAKLWEDALRAIADAK